MPRSAELNAVSQGLAVHAVLFRRLGARSPLQNHRHRKDTPNFVALQNLRTVGTSAAQGAKFTAREVCSRNSNRRAHQSLLNPDHPIESKSRDVEKPP